MRDRLLKLLGSGVSNAVAASAVGCTESYVSQLMAEEEFAQKVAALRFEMLQASRARDEKADTLEDKLLEKLETTLPLIMKPMEVLKALSTVNGLQRRSKPAQEQVHIQNQIIQLQMQTNVVAKLTLTPNKEIVAVDGRDLITMSSAQLLMEAKDHANNKLQATADNPAKIAQAA